MPGWLIPQGVIQSGVHLFVVFMLVITCIDQAHGQQIGLGFQTEFGKPFYFEREPGRINALGTGGEGKSQEIGLSLMPRMNVELGNSFSLSLGAGLGGNYGSYISESVFIDRFNPNYAISEPLSLIIIGPQPLADTRVNSYQHVQASISYLNVLSEIKFQQNISDDIHVSFGGWGKLPISTSTELQAIIDAPDNVRYPTGGSERQLPADQINSSLTAYGPMGGVSYLLQSRGSSSTYVEAGIRYNMASSDDITSRFSVSTGISLFWNSEVAEEIAEDPPPMIVETTPPPIFELTPDAPVLNVPAPEIRFMTLNSTRTLLASQREKEIEQYAPFLPVVVDDLSIQQQCELRPDEVDNFLSEEIPQFIPLYRNMLNVLADRLHRHPRSRARLSFAMSDRGDYAATRSLVMQHLTETWKIKPESVTPVIELVEIGERELLAIDGDARVTAPIKTSWVERSYSLSPIVIEHNGQFLERARLIVEQNGRVLQDTLVTSSPTMVSGFSISMGSRGVFPKIHARLEVTDSNGSMMTIADSLQIVLSNDLKEEITIVRFLYHPSTELKERLSLVNSAYADGSITEEEKDKLTREMSVGSSWHTPYPGLLPQSVDVATYQVLREVRVVEVERGGRLVPNADLQDERPSTTVE